jgi:hypothetical protein
MTPTEQQPVRDIPVWLTAIILLLCIAAGGWLVRWTLQQDKPGEFVTLADDKLPPAVVKAARPGGPLAPGGASRPPRNVVSTADGIHEQKNGWRINAGNTVMQVNPGRRGGPNEVNVYYAPQLRTAEEAELAMIRMSILSDSNWRDALKITDAQMAKLKAVPVATGMKIDDPDKARLADLFKAWQTTKDTAAKDAAAKTLTTALADIGKKCEAPTKQHEAARARAVQDALTPQQLAQYRGTGTPAAK